ncbi:hydrogenase maturation protease [Microbulbifer sp. SSSA007]|uniref:hydrogenase maturation protease n=1 Tax=unclassified Microbulbifer TaxID=2619833 RepID=UPI00403A30AE
MTNQEVSERWLLISLGNRFRSDDGVGPFLLQKLKASLGHAADFYESGGDMVGLLGQWKDRRVCLVDAVQVSGRKQGDLIRANGLADLLAPSLCNTSSHGFNLKEAIELGKNVRLLPRRLEIFAICAENFTCGNRLSAEVKRGAVLAEQQITELVQADNGGQQCTNNH